MEAERAFRISRADRGVAAHVGMLAGQLGEAPHWAAAAWEALGGGGADCCLLVARDGDGLMCGWIGGTCVLGAAEVETLLVLPAVRRQGVAARLLEAWLAWARTEGASACLLEVRASNAPALALYQRAGFALEGRRPRYYSAPEEDALLLRMVLA